MFKTHRVLLVGSVTRDAVVKKGARATRLLFTVSGTYRVIDQHGEIKNPTFYHRVKVFGNQLEAMAERLVGGRLVRVAGQLEYSSWETEGGEKRQSVELRGREVNLLTRQDSLEVKQNTKAGYQACGGVNEVELIANVSRDIKLTQTPSGLYVARLRLAYNEAVQRDGAWQQRTHYFDGEAWHGLAQRAHEELECGSTVHLKGHLSDDPRTHADGSKTSNLVIDVTEFLGLERLTNDGFGSESLPFDA
jgi:single-strand DNA-binding protein